MGEILQAILALTWVFTAISFVKYSKPIACSLINLVALACIILFIPLSTLVWTGCKFIFWSCHPSLSIPFEVGLLLHVVFLSVRMQSKCLTLIPNTNYQLLSQTLAIAIARGEVNFVLNFADLKLLLCLYIFNQFHSCEWCNRPFYWHLMWGITGLNLLTWNYKQLWSSILLFPKKELELLAEKNVLIKLFQYPLSLIAGNTLWLRSSLI